MKQLNNITGQIVDVVNRQIYPGTLHMRAGKIISIEKSEQIHEGPFILPGLIDSHIHIESSMLSPQQFAKVAVRHGTVATVSDPHEITNVLGSEGIDFMYEDGKQVPFKFYFGVPSCVPATPFETSGAIIDSQKIDELFQTGKYHYLAEMMNFPGVIHGDKEVLQKIEVARQHQLPVDGHAPGVKGDELIKYIQHGIS